MRLGPEHRERLIRYLDFLETELSDFPRFAAMDWKTYTADRDMRRNLERWIENLVNCSIDVAKVILASEDQPIPSSYRETLRALGATRFFDETFGEQLSRWASLRNILAHEYLDIRWRPIRQFLDMAEPAFRGLAKRVRQAIPVNG